MRFEICWVPFVSGRLLQLYDKVGEVDMIELQDLVGMCPIENWLIKTLVPVPSGTIRYPTRKALGNGGVDLQPIGYWTTWAMIVINDIAGAMLVHRFHRVLSSWEDLGNRRNTWKYGSSCCFGRKSMENQWKRVGTLKNIGKLVQHPSTSMEHWNNIGKSWKNNVENRWNIENQHLKSPGLRMCKPQRSSWGQENTLVANGWNGWNGETDLAELGGDRLPIYPGECLCTTLKFYVSIHVSYELILKWGTKMRPF